jgi:hypothetical protein
MQDRGYDPATPELIHVIRACHTGGRHSDLWRVIREPSAISNSI